MMIILDYAVRQLRAILHPAARGLAAPVSGP